MRIRSVSLSDYRNYSELDVSLGENVNILIGENAQGKTNFLEAIYFCSTGRSHRSHYDKELIAFNKPESHIQIFVEENGLEERIDAHIKRDQKKTLALNGIPVKKLGDLFGALYTVMFSPEDLDIIKGGPALRRRFMDMEICQTNKIYYYALLQYYRILKQRNNLLKSIQKDKDLIETLFAWDNQLVLHGNKIMECRASFIERINEIAKGIHKNITKGKENLVIEYKRNVNPDNFPEKLKKAVERDIYLGVTSHGIHKDDLIFYINGIDIRNYGSQGQKRTAALSAKLSEIAFIKAEKLADPVVLLDDVFSELDETRQSFLLSNVSDIQTIITCTGIEKIIGLKPTDSKVFNVCGGNILQKY